MTHERLRLVGGTVHDPANGIDGEVRDVCIEDGLIVASLPADAPTLDVAGMIVMPGGVDIHCHIASAGVNHARRLLADERGDDPAEAPELLEGIARSGTGGVVPSTFTTGYRYAALGYTTAFDAAVAPLTAKVCHASLDDTPIIDAGFFALMGNDEFLLQQIEAGERSRARDYIAWLLGAAGGYAVKIVNPGGIDAWKSGGRNLETIDASSRSERLTPRAILETLTTLANELALPHPVHIHCNNLGVPGNVATTLDSMRSIAGRRAHFTHLQFHSYGGERGSSWTSAAAQVADYVNSHPEVTGDVGQVMFGPALTLSADSPLEYALHQTTGQKWVNLDIELETGCGIVPYEYEEKAAAAALQWVVGLELFLLSNDPWRMVLSTDHPNGGSFLAYPQLIELLMSRDARRECLSRLNPRFLKDTALADGLSREYTLNEIAIISRAGPARILGLTHKGHLGVGADADVTVYQRSDDIAAMFAMPRYVFKAGVKVVEEAQLRRAPRGCRLHIRPEYDEALTPAIRKYFNDYATMRFEDYAVKRLKDPPQNGVR
jgi:formylmethanofuran dehydrogenase subunit A